MGVDIENPLSPPSQPSPLKGEGDLGLLPYRKKPRLKARGSTIPEGDAKPFKSVEEVYSGTLGL